MFYSSHYHNYIDVILHACNKAAVILTNKTAIKKYHQKTKMEK